jgi:hypothetical protein
VAANEWDEFLAGKTKQNALNMHHSKTNEPTNQRTNPRGLFSWLVG